MAVDRDTVAAIAKLARIRISAEQCETLTSELGHILGWIEQLDELDTEGVAPMTSVVEVELPLRDDEVSDGGYCDKIVMNAPEEAHGFFVVPKVLE